MKTGTHRARARAGVLTETQGDSHREHIYIKFGLVSDMNDVVEWQGYFGDNKDKGGKTLTERTIDVLRVCGWEGDDIRDLRGIEKNEVEIVVLEDTYQGNSRLKVRYVQPIGTAAAFMPKPLESRYADQLAERIKRKITGGESSASPAEDFGPPRQTVPDEDIPF